MTVDQQAVDTIGGELKLLIEKYPRTSPQDIISGKLKDACYDLINANSRFSEAAIAHSSNAVMQERADLLKTHSDRIAAITAYIVQEEAKP